MIDKNTLLQIEKIALQIDHDVAFGGKSKGNKHLSRVVRIAKFFAQKMGANKPVTTAGAFLHDTALPSGNDYDYTKNKKIVKDILASLDLSKDELEGIAECVASHEGTTAPKTLEAQIIHDADVIEKTGLLGIIRHTWKLTNSGKIDHTVIKDADVRTVLDHVEWRRKQLQTPLAQKIGAYLSIPVSARKAKNIMAVAAPLAFAGVVTEKIALAVRRHLTKKENERLKEQLNVGYLKRFK